MSSQLESPWGVTAGLGDSNALEDSLSGKRWLRLKVARAALAAARLNRTDAQRTLELVVKSAYITAGASARQPRLRAAGADRRQPDLSAQPDALQRRRHQRSRSGQGRDDEARGRPGGRRRRRRRCARPRCSWRFSSACAAASPTTRSIRICRSSSCRRRSPLRRPTRCSTRRSIIAPISRRSSCSASARWRRSRSPSATAFPTSASTSATRSRPAPPRTPRSHRRCRSASCGTLPLFYFQQGEIKKAEADYRTQELQRAKTQAQLVADVEGAYNAFVSSRKLVERMERRLLDRSKRARDLVSLQYQKGAASLFEYLDAQRTFIANNVEYLQDLANYWTAVYQLEAAIGDGSTMKRHAVILFLVAAGCGGHTSSAAQPQPPAGEAWLTTQQVKNANLTVQAGGRSGRRRRGGHQRHASRSTTCAWRTCSRRSPAAWCASRRSRVSA